MIDPDDEEDQAIVREVASATTEANGVIQQAILHAMMYIETENAWMKLLGIEMALLAHAARIRLISQDQFGAKNTVDSFLSIARDVYEDVNEQHPPELKPPELKATDMPT